MRKIRKDISANLSLDSLMDILTCSVGIMLLLVIFIIIMVKDTEISMATPMIKDPPPNRQRKIFLCQNGKIKLWDFDRSIKALTEGIEMYEMDLNRFTRIANRRNITDGYFKYSLKKPIFERVLVVIEPLQGTTGTSMDDLSNPDSDFLNKILEFSTSEVWFMLLVDEESLTIFFKVRKFLREKGYTVGWDPMAFSFPLSQCVYNCVEGGYGIGIFPQS